MATAVRPYDPARDRDAVVRIWREVGWIDSSPEQAAALEVFLAAGNANVGVMDDSAECLVHWTEGSIRHDESDLRLCAVTAVTTSWVGRKQGLASRMTAAALAEGADKGAEVAVLGQFEQGFYNRFGFGTGSYEHRLMFDPASITVDAPYRTPSRLTKDDAADIHAAMVGRTRVHGSVVLDPPGIVQAEFGWLEDPFGLGYRTDGRLTHFVLGKAKGENGPYDISWMGYETTDQLLELLRLLKELGDQVASVRLIEPPELQLQDVLHQPIRQRIRSAKSDHETSHTAIAWWQLRILDLAACVSGYSWSGPDVAFNLTIDDPLDAFLDEGWRGVGGDYTVTIGAASSAKPGHSTGLPTLNASVNAFSRLWFGVRPASSLALTDDLSGPQELLEQLDAALRLPPPRPGWLF